MKIVVGITGASGAIYGIRLLEELKKQNVETHLMISKWGEKTIACETDYSMDEVIGKSDYYYSADNLAASVSSGSFRHDGMVIAPCSMKTLSSIANGYSDNLISRAADACLKERRRLILMVRESPLSLIHIRNMETVTLAGAVVIPPMPSFYNRPETVDDIINHSVSRVLDHLRIDNELTERWHGGR